MKISIELEISETEVPHTVEMIKLLKEITENIKIKNSTHGTQVVQNFSNFDENKFRSEISEILSSDIKRNFEEMTLKLSTLLEKNVSEKMSEIFEQEFTGVVMDKRIISKHLNASPFIYLLFLTK
jgi:formate dehydrogenase maturation protein FdhE